MVNGPQDFKQHLMATDENFRKLATQHHQYDEQLQAFASKTYLSEQEQLEEIRMKKLKLRLKDEMEQRIQQYKQEHASVA